MTALPTFAELVRPLLGGDRPDSLAALPLSELPAGDYAVLAWLDDVTSRYPAAVEADLVARWDQVSLREVYDVLAAAEVSGAEAGAPGARVPPPGSGVGGVDRTGRPADEAAAS